MGQPLPPRGSHGLMARNGGTRGSEDAAAQVQSREGVWGKRPEGPFAGKWTGSVLSRPSPRPAAWTPLLLEAPVLPSTLGLLPPWGDVFWKLLELRAPVPPNPIKPNTAIPRLPPEPATLLVLSWTPAGCARPPEPKLRPADLGGPRLRGAPPFRGGPRRSRVLSTHAQGPSSHLGGGKQFACEFRPLFCRAAGS